MRDPPQVPHVDGHVPAGWQPAGQVGGQRPGRRHPGGQVSRPAPPAPAPRARGAGPALAPAAGPAVPACCGLPLDHYRQPSGRQHPAGAGAIAPVESSGWQELGREARESPRRLLGGRRGAGGDARQPRRRRQLRGMDLRAHRAVPRRRSAGDRRRSRDFHRDAGQEGQRVVASDLSERCVSRLRDRFSGEESVKILPDRSTPPPPMVPSTPWYDQRPGAHRGRRRRPARTRRPVAATRGRVVLWVPAFSLLYSDFDRRIGSCDRRYRRPGTAPETGLIGIRRDTRYFGSSGT